MSRPFVWLFLLALACSGPTVTTHEVVGTVTDVEPGLRQIMIAHEDIPGLMPAMTMNFDVAEPGLLAGINTGDRVRFTLSVEGARYRIVALAKLGAGESAAGESDAPEPEAEAEDAPLGAVASVEDAAPAFTLLNQDGRALALEELRGSLVLLDFIYTTCPGPCPILTSARVELQQALPEELVPKVRFLSISLDPERDTPEALRAYALARGADLERWSFLTGDPATVDAVIGSYGVGKIRQENGEIEHVIVTFLIDGQGLIVKRYFGLEHDSDEYLRDLAAAAAG